jgi:hypothetical protein
MANGHGGRRIGAGRKAKSLQDKLLEGNPGKRPVRVLSIPDDCAISPELPEYLSEFAVFDIEFSIEETYARTVKWLERTKCLHLINPELVEEYALLKTRWRECEFVVSNKFLMESTSGVGVEPSVMIESAARYLKLAGEVWDKIWTVVAANSMMPFGDDSGQDGISRYLNTKPKR